MQLPGTGISLSKNLKNALTYPSILLLVMLIIIVILISKVLPVFDEVYASFGGSLSGIAGQLVSLGNVLNKALPFMGIIIGAIVAVAATIYLIPQAANATKRFFTRLFGDKGAMRKTNNALVAQALSITLATLSASKLSIPTPFRSGLMNMSHFL
mgnify:CR=1 FL=1